MKAKQIPITSGPASGTLVTEVRSNNDRIVGYIRVVAVEFPGFGCFPCMFIAQQVGRSYKRKLCDCLLDAYLFLGISSKELDNSDLGEYPYTEHS